MMTDVPSAINNEGSAAATNPTLEQQRESWKTEAGAEQINPGLKKAILEGGPATIAPTTASPLSTEASQPIKSFAQETKERLEQIEAERAARNAAAPKPQESVVKQTGGLAEIENFQGPKMPVKP